MQKHLHFLQGYRLFVWMIPCNSCIARQSILYLPSFLPPIQSHRTFGEERNFPPTRKRPRWPGSVELSCLRGTTVMSSLVIICQNANIVESQAPMWSFCLRNVADVHIILPCIYLFLVSLNIFSSACNSFPAGCTRSE